MAEEKDEEPGEALAAGPEPEEAAPAAAPELQEEKEAEEERAAGPEPAAASAASLHSEAPEAEGAEEEAAAAAAGAEAEAESVSALPSSEEPPAAAAAAEGEAPAEEAEEKPEAAAAPEEPPEGEEARAEAEATRAPSEEAAPSEAEEKEAAAEAMRAPSLRAPSPAASLGRAPPMRTSVSSSSEQLLGVDLGRSISLSLWELEQRRLSGVSLLGSSAGSEASEAGAESEEQREERLAQERRRREELTEEYRQLQAERRRLRSYNAKLQGKLAELLNKGGGGGGGKGKEAPPRAELEQHISDREQRYNRYLALLEELRSQQAAEGAWYQKQVDALQGSCHERLAKVEAEWKAHQAVKKEVAVFTMGRRLGGRQAAVREVDQIQAREQSKEKEMTEVRLEYIKLKHRIQKLEASLKAQEELAEGLHLIDFEQLKIENQTYNEKIEERNEELLKLRRRITNTVQIISQVKEKLQFVEAENHGQKAQLMAAEALVAQKREILTKTKQARDKLRMDNQRLQQKCGLLGHTLLLRDFENKVSASEALKGRLDILKRRHAGLTLTCRGIKKKLQGVTSFLPL